ncbi:hypothetical protein ACRE1S_06625 [Helicobacter himalayensis]|uniref:hypothetical protein n=1 Tax=Helicobacter himalayensis TaxID=1591088 RepID=UPI003D6DB92B
MILDVWNDFINDGLEYSSKEHEVSINGEKIKLTLKEFELLGFLRVQLLSP